MNNHPAFFSWQTVLIVLPLVLLATACGDSAAPPSQHTAHEVAVNMVLYTEQEAGTGPYPVRILVSANYVRVDDGYDESDYVLLDRHTRTLFSVVHENQSILEIRNQPVDAALPEDLSMDEEHGMVGDAPPIAGKQPLHTAYLANGELCYQAISVPGLLENTVAGMNEFATALGERQLANMETVPEAMRTPCFLSRYAYAPGRHYSHGLPVQLWDEAGFNRSLTDFRDGEAVAPVLFQLPDSYQRLTL